MLFRSIESVEESESWEYSYNLSKGKSWADEIPEEPLHEHLGKWEEINFVYRGPN